MLQHNQRYHLPTLHDLPSRTPAENLHLSTVNPHSPRRHNPQETHTYNLHDPPPSRILPRLPTTRSVLLGPLVHTSPSLPLLRTCHQIYAESPGNTSSQHPSTAPRTHHFVTAKMDNIQSAPPTRRHQIRYQGALR